MDLKIHTLIELGIWIWFVEKKKVKLGIIWAGRIPQSLKKILMEIQWFCNISFKIKVSNWNMPMLKGNTILFGGKIDFGVIF